jgi:hypothetical protein
VRAAAGWNLLVHSWGKITVGPASGFLKAFVDIDFTPPAAQPHKLIYALI